MKKYLGLNTFLASSLVLTACSNEEIGKTTNKAVSSTTTTKSTEVNQDQKQTETSTSKQTFKSTEKTSQTSSSASTQTSFSSISGSYPAVNGGTYTLKDSKTIIYSIDGEEKILTIKSISKEKGLTVAYAEFTSIGGKAVTSPSPVGSNVVPFYIVPAGEKSPLTFVGEEDTSRDRVVTLNNAFYLN